jgi:hypothetical protein
MVRQAELELPPVVYKMTAQVNWLAALTGLRAACRVVVIG